MRLDNVRLLTDNFGRAFRFYVERLGLQVSFSDEQGPYADFQAGAASLALFDHATMMNAIGGASASVPAGDAAVVVIEVDDEMTLAA